jgi:hypothetical protein
MVFAVDIASRSGCRAAGKVREDEFFMLFSFSRVRYIVERQAQLAENGAAVVVGGTFREGSRWKPAEKDALPPAGERESLSGVRAGTALELGECHELARSPGEFWLSQGWRLPSGLKAEA